MVFGDIDYQFNDAEQEKDSFVLQDLELWDNEVDDSDLLLILSDCFMPEDMPRYLEGQDL